MNRSLILVLALTVFIGWDISCQSKANINNASPETTEPPDEICNKQANPCSCTGCINPCNNCFNCPCYKKQEKLIADFEKLNEQVVEYLQVGNYTRALEILQDMNNKFPSNIVVLYNIVCVYSLMNKPEDAISCLRDAVKCGWKDWKYMDNDSDLYTIKNKSEYKKIRDELKKDSPDNPDEDFDEGFDEDADEGADEDTDEDTDEGADK